MTALDKNNGCSSTTVFAVADGRIYPNLDSIGGSQLLCGAITGTVGFRSLDGLPDNKMDITWNRMEGTPEGPFDHKNNRIFTVSRVGNYQALVINIDNGCAKTVTTTILPDSLTADFSADNISGYAPLTVKLTNTSFSSNKATATASINSIWDFGNGKSLKQKSDSFDVAPSVVFTQAGTYNVTLYINRGQCLEQVSKLIQVDIPSSLSVPNIFTPNGDGVNDLFFIKSANLSEINASIFDRWGHLVYQLKNEKGRIEWDGKNQFGKECAEGTYFYTIKAIGSDGNSFNEKGTISLVR